MGLAVVGLCGAVVLLASAILFRQTTQYPTAPRLNGSGLTFLVSRPDVNLDAFVYVGEKNAPDPSARSLQVVFNIKESTGTQLDGSRPVTWAVIGSGGWRFHETERSTQQGPPVRVPALFPGQSFEAADGTSVEFRVFPRPQSETDLSWYEPKGAVAVVGTTGNTSASAFLELDAPLSDSARGRTLGAMGPVGCPSDLAASLALGSQAGYGISFPVGYVKIPKSGVRQWAVPLTCAVSVEASVVRPFDRVDAVVPKSEGFCIGAFDSLCPSLSWFRKDPVQPEYALTFEGARWQVADPGAADRAGDSLFLLGVLVGIGTGLLMWFLQSVVRFRS